LHTSEQNLFCRFFFLSFLKLKPLQLQQLSLQFNPAAVAAQIPVAADNAMAAMAPPNASTLEEA
jgi:hypothetical protein